MKSFLFCTLVLLIVHSCRNANLRTSEKYQAWMNNPLFLDKTLLEMTIPGTHDSATYNLTDHIIELPSFISELIKIADFLHLPVGHLIIGWAQAQDLTIYEQLKKGIRYLDMRIGWFNNEWHSCHNWVIAQPLEESIQGIKRFLDENPTEVLVVEFQHIHLGSEANITDLIVKMKDLYGNYLFPRTKSLSDYTLGDMVKLNERLIITFSNSQAINDHPEFWYLNTIINTYANSPDVTTMQQYNQKQVRAFHNEKRRNQLFKISYDLTPNKKTIEESIFPGKPKTLFDLIKKANPTLDKWLVDVQSHGYEYPILGNIFIIDHFETSNIVQIIVDENIKSATATKIE